MKRLFGKAKLGLRQLCSDSTLQRVLHWIAPHEASTFLHSVLSVVWRRQADTIQLIPEGPHRRVIIGDGSVMGNHHVADFPVRVVRLIERPLKGSGRDEPHISWIVTTDFSLSPRELREAAHVRWSIENNVFKRLSGAVATKRLHFKEQQPFITMLRIVGAAVIAYDVLTFMMDRHSGGRKGWIGPLKQTYGIVFAVIYALLEDNCLA